MIPQYTIPKGTQRMEDRWDEKARIREFLEAERISRSQRLAEMVTLAYSGK